MPFLDVTEVLADPDFATTINVTRSTKVASGGVVVVTPGTPQTVPAVVEPTNSQDLLRMPGMDRNQGAITIWTTFRLLTQDLVDWNGNTYTVMTSDDWSQFGAGYIKALCQQQTI